jgi:hypothetical protein
VLVFTWTTSDGSVVVTEKYRLDTTNGLFVQPGLSGTPSAKPNVPNPAVILFRSIILNNFGQDLGPTGTTETVVGVGYNNGEVYPWSQNGMDGLTQFYTVAPTMSFWGRLRGQDGIYVGVEDPGTAPKVYRILPPNYGNTDYWDYVGLFPSPPVAGSPIQPTWWMHLQPVHGDRDWAMITDLYKAWAIPAKTYLTSLSARTDLPQALKDGLLWQIAYAPDSWVANDLLNYVSSAHKVLTGTIGWHLYNYYGPEGFDRGNGGATYAGIEPKTPSLNICGTSYNSSCGDWAGAVSMIQGNGDIVTPYMNPNDGDLCGLNSSMPCGDCGRGQCDSNHNGGLPYPSDASELAPLACGSVSSTSYIGHVNAGGWLAPMDPTSAGWRAKVVTMWNNATSLGARGVYLDTYGAWGLGCFPSLGWSGNLITAGESAIAQVHTMGDPVHFVTSENLSDNMQKLSDVLMDYSYQPEHSAPLHQAVYHPYKIIVGPANYVTSLNALEWSIRLGRAWAWGNQTGITDSSAWAATQSAYMNRLYSAHLALTRFLSYGDVYSPMLQGSSGTTDTTVMNTWQEYPGAPETTSNTTFSYIQGLYWLSSSGEYALVYTNTDPNSSHQFDAYIPTTLQGVKVQDCNYDGTGCVDATSQLLNGGTEIQLTAAANQARLVEFTVGIDAQTSKDGKSTLTTNAFSTTANSDLLVAFVAYDGPSQSTPKQTATVSGAGLSWQLVQRSNTQLGDAEIWAAQATSVLTGVTVSAQPGISLPGGTHGSLTVIAFSHTSGIGNAAQASAPSGAPDVSVSGVTAGSWVFAVGNDWNKDIPRTTVSGQYPVHQDTDHQVHDTYWVQATVVPSTTDGAVDIHDTAPTTDQWNYAAVEILAP